MTWVIISPIRFQNPSETITAGGPPRVRSSAVKSRPILGVMPRAGKKSADTTAAVTLTPATTSVESNVPVTYTLTINCSGTGGCTDTKVTFPSTTITGNGTHDDFGSWVGNSSCSGVTVTRLPLARTTLNER